MTPRGNVCLYQKHMSHEIFAQKEKVPRMADFNCIMKIVVDG